MTQDKTIQLTTLDNGLRIITDNIPSVHSIAIGIWVGVGTRHEDMRYNGVSHMVEHMLFKGTKNRTAKQIANEIEAVGGHMNAYTSREITSYHAHLLKDDASLALNVLGDMVQNSTLPDDEIARERDVILQEIGMCNDTPDDLVFDLFYETAWKEQGLGAPILGTADIISSMGKEPLQAHINRHYTPDNIVVSAAGNLSHDKIVADVQTYLSALPKDKTGRPESASYTGGQTRMEKDLEQTHVMLGFAAPSRFDDLHYSARAFSAILGSGMSSRLFQEIREKRGLVYSVYSFCSAYNDGGIFGVYAGTAPEKLDELLPVTCNEILSLSQTLTDEEIARVKIQMKTNILMARESMMTRADSQAKYLIHRNKVLDTEDMIVHIDAIDRKSIEKAAEFILSSKPTLTGLGPLSALESYDTLQTRMAA